MAEQGDMLIPVYIIGFILGGIFLLAVAQRVPHPGTRMALRAVAIFSGPLFFIVVFSFSGWEREKTYEVQWLTGRSTEEYLGHDKSLAKTQEDLVVLRRNIGNNNECYDGFASGPLARYLESLPTHSVKVRYAVTYDFYEPRTYRIEKIGDFGHGPGAVGDIGIGMLVGGERVFRKSLESCLPW
jgi:hypothetical protein